MTSLKGHLMDEITSEISIKKSEIERSNKELEMFNAKLKVENKSLTMVDLPATLKEDFKYSAQALEDMILMESGRNSELKKDLEVLNFRKEVIASQFTNSELNS